MLLRAVGFTVGLLIAALPAESAPPTPLGQTDPRRNVAREPVPRRQRPVQLQE